MNPTAVQWTDMSWNPIRAKWAKHHDRIRGHFCQKISPGCANCYASALQRRFRMPQFPGTNKTPADNGVEVYLDEGKLLEPLRKRQGRKVFVCDMSDLFGEWVPFEFIDKVFAVMPLTPQHTYQILTKRAERMADYVLSRAKSSAFWEKAVPAGRALRWKHDGLSHPLCPFPLPNCWLGVSAEDQKRLHERVPHLLRCPAAIRFLSLEPLLDGIDLMASWGKVDGTTVVAAHGVDWVIVGGESGPNARPCNVEWVRSIVRQCRTAGTKCFVKQLGREVVDRDTTSADHFDNAQCWPEGTRLWALDEHHVVLNDSKGGNPEEWPMDLRVREMPV